MIKTNDISGRFARIIRHYSYDSAKVSDFFRVTQIWLISQPFGRDINSRTTGEVASKFVCNASLIGSLRRQTGVIRFRADQGLKRGEGEQLSL